MFKKSKADKQSDLSRGSLDPRDPSNYDYVSPPTFVRMIVLDVISDPNNDLKDSKKTKKWRDMNISNIDSYSSILPRNTIIARRIGEYSNPMFVFPFFPSHLSLPCKPGESVWVMFENPNEPESNLAFWFGRIIDSHQSDDINHSHPSRIYEIKTGKNAKDLVESDTNSWVELRNAPSLTVGEDRFTIGESILLPGAEEDIFEKLITESDASKLVTYESVPRFRKRPGDVVLEGTNNSLIVLGSDRLGGTKKTEFKSESGTVDIVAGRGQTTTTSGKEKTVTSLRDARGKNKGSEIKKELDKSENSVAENEGDPDYTNDRSRILISQKTSPDKYFKLDSSNSKLGITDSSEGDSAVVIKSDKVRLIARSDVQILVSGFSQDKNTTGESIKKEETDTGKWASITITSKGEIIIKPSESGLIKLGGEDADKAILCSKSIPKGIGKVTGLPLTDTLGGINGVEGAETTGVYSSKVLIK